MTNDVIYEIFKPDTDFVPTLARKQHWKEHKFSYLKRARPDSGLMLLLNGRIDFVFEGGMLCAKKGDVIFLPQGSHYDAVFHVEQGETDNYLINFNMGNTHISCCRPQKILKNASLEIAESFRQIIEEKYSCEVRSIREKGLFYLLIDMILMESKADKSNADTILEKAKILLQSSKDIPISRIARECSVSESGLRRIFGELMGMSPVQYRLSTKINKAKYLLESTDMTISAIADVLNFYDAAYFCRVFGKYTGVTPKMYLESKKL